MTGTELALSITDLDHKLESTAEAAVIELFQHRWHWTMNPENPDRITHQAYADAVGRSYATVRAHASGYANWLADPTRPLASHVARANYSIEGNKAADAVAEAFGLQYSSARSLQGEVIKNVRDEAKDLAETKQIPIEDAMKERAEFYARTEEARRKDRKDRAAQHGLRFVGVETEITKARNALNKALQESRDVEWTDQERTILGESIQKLSALLSLTDLAITGSAKVDWDAELAKLGVA